MYRWWFSNRWPTICNKFTTWIRSRSTLTADPCGSGAERLSYLTYSLSTLTAPFSAAMSLALLCLRSPRSVWTLFRPDCRLSTSDCSFGSEGIPWISPAGRSDGFRVIIPPGLIIPWTVLSLLATPLASVSWAGGFHLNTNMPRHTRPM
jgi:hypothetical protein